MGKTNQLGVLADVFTSDASLNVGIGGSPSGSYKLEVTGTAKVSSTLLVSGAATFSSSVAGVTGNFTNSTSGNTFIIGTTYAGGRNIQIGISDGSILPTAAAYINDNTGVGVYIGDNSAATKGLYVKNGGNVGIGTSSPANLLHLAGTSATPSLRLSSSANIAFYWDIGRENASTGDFVFNNAVGGAATERMRITSGGNVLIGSTSDYAGILQVSGQLSIIRSTGYAWLDYTNTTANNQYSFLQNVTDGFLISVGKNGTSTAPYLALGTADTERMRITSGGFLKVSNNGTYQNTAGSYHEIRSNTTDSDTIIIQNTAASPYGGNIYFPNAAPNNTTNYFLLCYDNSNTKLFVYSNGSLYNRTGTYGPISDVKLKENIIDATPKLDDILKLKVRNFNFIDDETKQKQIGFIAQEFEEVFPTMVDTNTDKEGESFKAIKTSVLVPMLVKAIQEQHQLITSLQDRLDKLENK